MYQQLLQEALVDRSGCLHNISAQLKQDAGLQMEGMVTDLQLAREKQQDFDRWKGDNNKALPIDVNVTVLTTGFWPTYKVPAAIPVITIQLCTVCLALPHALGMMKSGGAFVWLAALDATWMTACCHCSLVHDLLSRPSRSCRYGSL